MHLRLALTLTVPFFVRARDTGASSDDPCEADADNMFHATLDPYASSTGYYKFAECGDTPMPVLAMERGVTYKFDQSDASNWYHPLGFAYYADGAHKGVDELEPGISQSGSACVDDNTCQAPMYYKDGAFLGEDGYDNTKPNNLQGGEDFGLDFYEPEFFYTREHWSEAVYHVEVTISDTEYAGDLFYFCHIHNWMSGRIKVTDGGAKVQNRDDPELGYELETPSTYDASCGTYGVSEYQEDSGKCDDLFVCTDGDESRAQKDFGECLYAMDCHMNYHMKTILNEESPVATFMHQMIPHHQNAVNMAKALLKTGALDAESEADAEVIDILWGIINIQNKQNHVFEQYLADGGYAAEAHCSRDDAAWHKRGDTAKDCAWVGKFLPIRCAVKGADGTTAQESCAGTCDGQEESSDSSED